MELSKSEAAGYLGVSPRTLELYTKQGKIGVKYVKASRGKQARYQQSDLDELKAELHTDTHKPVVAEETSQNPANLASSPYEVSHLVEKLLVPLSTHLTNLTSAVQHLQLPPEENHAATRPLVPVEEKLLLTLTEVQALTGLSREILKEAIDGGELPARIMGKAWRIKRSDLEDWIEEL